MAKPADLKPGDRLDTALGTLIVDAEPWGDLVPDDPQWDRIFVDVRVEEGRSWKGDPDRLPEATGASESQWLGLMPLRYRLAFKPDADVQVTR